MALIDDKATWNRYFSPTTQQRMTQARVDAANRETTGATWSVPPAQALPPGSGSWVEGHKRELVVAGGGVLVGLLIAAVVL